MANNPAQSIMTGQVTVTNAATLISAQNLAGLAVMVENMGTTAVYLGGSSVTTSTGFLLPGVVGASVSVPFTGALYGITASGTAAVCYMGAN